MDDRKNLQLDALYEIAELLKLSASNDPPHIAVPRGVREYLAMESEGMLGAMLKDPRAIFMLGALVGDAMRYAATIDGSVENHDARKDLLDVARALGTHLRGPKGTP